MDLFSKEELYILEDSLNTYRMYNEEDRYTVDQIKYKLGFIN